MDPGLIVLKVSITLRLHWEINIILLLESDSEIFKAYEEGQKWSQSMMVAFENEYLNATELIKKYKLFQFSSWFEEPNNFYKLFTELWSYKEENRGRACIHRKL